LKTSTSKLADPLLQYLELLGSHIRNLYLDNSDGDAPNNRSNGLPAGYNSDGFDMSSTNNSIITDSTVLNQDDCVAVTSGNNITISNMYCSGGHGMRLALVERATTTSQIFW